MKIEKINENQIRCTLSSADLTSRKINLAELAYGSEKAKNLFYDMMQQAHQQFGFDPNGTPLMIEAIPSFDSLTLIVTKVQDPEELDTRFSSFSPSTNASSPELHITGADGILNLLKKIKEAAEGAAAKKNTDAKKGTAKASAKEAGAADAAPAHLIEAFRFHTLDDVILAARAAGSPVRCINSLYKFDSSTYLLILHSPQEDPEGFNRLCNILSEYSFSDHCAPATENYLREHGCLMIADTAVQKLAAL